MKDEEIKEMCNDIYEGGEWQPMIDYITNLQEENERLKEQKEHLLIDLEGESEYKIMCEKAIEIIKLCNSKCAKEVINILQGSDKE